ncbi:MAG: tetratricopeptide repeat protein [Chromatiales bacterium]|jgi:tetratricopeptide (TPR) repeat protein
MIVRAPLSLLSPLILAWLLATSVSARADERPSISPQTYQILQETQQLLDQGQSVKAVQRLEELVQTTAKHPYEQAVALQSLANAHIERNDYTSAIAPLQRSVELASLPAEAQQQARYNLAQLYMATDRFAPAIEQLKLWFKQAKSAPAEAYMLLGSAHLQLKQYRQAIEPLRQAIRLSNRINEGWYQSLLGAYYESKQYSEAVKLLHKMLRLFPDSSDYWRQLAGIELMRRRDGEALAVMELAYLNGKLTKEQDLLNLAQLYAQRDAPYKAAQLLEKELKKGRIKAGRKTWEQTANAWQLARELEPTVTALEKALSFERNPELSLRLARLYLEVNRPAAAEKTLRQFLKQSKGKHTDEAWLLLGIACHEGKSLEQARQAFNQALKSANTRDQAQQWLSYLESKQG